MSSSSEQLARRAQDGDTLAVDALVRRHAGMTRSIASLFYLAGSDRADVRQEALIGLWKAIRDYRDGHGATFESFAELCIRRHLIAALIGANRQKHQPLNDAYLFSMAVHGVDGDRMELGDLFEDSRLRDPEIAITERNEFRALIAFIATRLSDLEREALVGLAVNGESHTDVLRRLGREPSGVTSSGKPRPKTVENAMDRARLKCRRFIQVERDAA